MTIEEYFQTQKLNLDAFDPYQMHEIRLGLEEGLDVLKYADPKFTAEQMSQIRISLKNNKK